MELYSNIEEESLKHKAIVYVTQSVIATWVIVIGCVTFTIIVFVAMFVGGSSLSAKLGVGGFLLAWLGFMLIGLFFVERFYIAANNEGWFYKANHHQYGYVFVPWLMCHDVNVVTDIENSKQLCIEVKCMAFEDFPKPKNGSMTVHPDFIEFRIGGLFNATQVAEELRMLMRVIDNKRTT